MVDSFLLNLLRCPETMQNLHLASNSQISRINRDIQSGHCRNRSGQYVSRPIDTGLVRDDGRILYPVRNDIPVMLPEESIPLKDQPE